MTQSFISHQKVRQESVGIKNGMTVRLALPIQIWANARNAILHILLQVRHIQCLYAQAIYLRVLDTQNPQVIDKLFKELIFYGQSRLGLDKF